MQTLTGRAVMQKKEVVEDCQTVSVFDLRQQGYFSELKSDSANENARLAFSYSVKNDQVKSLVDITKTPCHFGGFRVWFICPTCNKKVAVLYHPPYRTFCKCRSCHGLSYESRQLSGSGIWELIWRIQKVKERYREILAGIGQKGASKVEQRQLKRIVKTLTSYSRQWKAITKPLGRL
jgi:hypothetical protein